MSENISSSDDNYNYGSSDDNYIDGYQPFHCFKSHPWLTTVSNKEKHDSDSCTRISYDLNDDLSYNTSDCKKERYLCDNPTRSSELNTLSSTDIDVKEEEEKVLGKYDVIEEGNGDEDEDVWEDFKETNPTSYYMRLMSSIRGILKPPSVYKKVLDHLFHTFVSTKWIPEHNAYFSNEDSEFKFHILVPKSCSSAWVKINSMKDRKKISPQSDVFVESLDPYISSFINDASESIDIAMYKFTDSSVLDLLQRKWQQSNRKIRIRVLLNRATCTASIIRDKLFTFLLACFDSCGSDDVMPEVLYTSKGIEKCFHIKLYLRDSGTKCINGSSNTSHCGLNFNWEIINVSINREFNYEFQKLFNDLYDTYSADIENNLLYQWITTLPSNSFDTLKRVVTGIVTRYPSLVKVCFERQLQEYNVNSWLHLLLPDGYDASQRLLDTTRSSGNETYKDYLKNQLYEMYCDAYKFDSTVNQVPDDSYYAEKLHNLRSEMKDARSIGITLLHNDLDSTYNILRAATKNILIFSITIGQGFTEELVKIKSIKPNMVVVLVFWTLQQEVRDQLTKSGIVLIQVSMGCQHIKTIIVDDKVVTNSGSANLSTAAYEGSNREVNVNTIHKHKNFEVSTMKLLSLLGVYAAVGL